MKLKKEDYEFLAKYVPEIDDYAKRKKVDNLFVHFHLNDENYQNIQSDINDSIVAYGMDQQENINDIGKKLYQIYDLLPHLDDQNLEYFNE